MTERSTIAILDRPVKYGYDGAVPRPRQFDEDQVIGAISDQFWDRGYAATSLSDLMTATGLGKGSLYAAFGDKHQLLMRTVRAYNEANRRRLQRRFAEAPRALDALRAFLRAPVRDDSGAAARRGCFMANSTTELAGCDDELLDEARAVYDGTAAILAEAVARAQREGDVDPAVGPLQLARDLLVAQQGLVFMGRAGTDIVVLRATADSLAAQLLPTG